MREWCKVIFRTGYIVSCAFGHRKIWATTNAENRTVFVTRRAMRCLHALWLINYEVQEFISAAYHADRHINMTRLPHLINMTCYRLLLRFACFVILLVTRDKAQVSATSHVIKISEVQQVMVKYQQADIKFTIFCYIDI